MAQSLAEQETHLNMVADNRKVWEVFTDDPVLIRKMDRIGAVLVREESGGGRHYTLDAKQVLLRKISTKRTMSDAQRENIRTRLAASRKSL